MVDLIDRAQAREQFDREQALIAQRRRTAPATEPAKDGRCVECDEPIGAKRLKALPMTGRCIECAKRAEREQAWRI